MSAIISFDREATALRFACPDSSRMRWVAFGTNGVQCNGCSGACGMSIPLPGQVMAPQQAELFNFRAGQSAKPKTMAGEQAESEPNG